jgi:hypothetical protein
MCVSSFILGSAGPIASWWTTRALRVAILTPIVLPCDVEGDVPHSPVCVCVCGCLEREREGERKIERGREGEEGGW